LEGGEQEIKKQVQDQSSKEAKLNRALEEVEKLKFQLREARLEETSKNEQIRRDLDRLQEENKKIERQRAELLQAFKKQMKLIDVLKRQKMHIESAKLLAFTEDEFVRTLELGDKI
jgi:septal ring factor EnvC (AmiA/AmiB activator)